MEWIVENSNDYGVDEQKVCYRGDCSYYTGCWDCPSNKGFCLIKQGGPSCNSRSCGIYIT